MRTRASRRAQACWLVAALLASAVAAVLAHRTARDPGPGVQPHGLFERRWQLFWEVLAWWAVFAVAGGCLLRVRARVAVPVVIGVAVVLRLAALAPVAPLSDDLYRYAWDGKVQAAGIDPYRYAPNDPALARVRDRWLWPDPAGCAQLSRPAGCSRLNREAVPTIYPPAAQAAYLVEHAVLPSGAHDRGYEILGMLADLAVLAVLLALLRSWGRDPRWAVLYAWCRTAVLEAVQNAHVDVLAALVTVLVLRAAVRRPLLAAALIGVATLIKLYPAVLLALVLRRRPVATLAVFTGVVVGGYLPHVLAVGSGVAGYLPGYLHEQKYGSGTGYLLLSAIGITGTAASAVAVLLLAATGGWVLFDRRSAPDVRARRLFGALLLVTTPAAAWYALPMLAVVAAGGAWWWLPVVFAAYPAFFTQSLTAPDDPQGQAVYGYVGALVVLMLRTAAGVAHRRTGTLLPAQLAPERSTAWKTPMRRP